METSNYTVKVIKASEGKYLTQAQRPAEARHIVVTSEPIYLAINDSEANYREIDEAEAQALLAERADARASV